MYASTLLQGRFSTEALRGGQLPSQQPASLRSRNKGKKKKKDQRWLETGVRRTGINDLQIDGSRGRL